MTSGSPLAPAKDGYRITIRAGRGSRILSGRSRGNWFSAFAGKSGRGATAAAALILAFAPGALAAEPGNAPVSVEITAAETGPWTALWHAPAPTDRLVFARSTNDQRVRDWSPVDPAFEIVRAGEEGEVVRRKDGKRFRTVRLRMPARYAELPKDYAPFSPFGDGGVLFHSGRFFACTGMCPDGARWPIRLRVGDRRVLLDGQERRGAVSWTDANSGRNVYVGEAKPTESGDVVAVIDAALPAEVKAELDAQLPRFMRRFAGELGALKDRPMLFVSWNLDAPGQGRQGGTLPGQVFVHFYGAGWPEQAKTPWFAEDLAWHLAHEAAHLYQRQIFDPDSRGAWVHEGAADALAEIALFAEGGKSAEYAARKLAKFPEWCAADRKDVSVRDAIAAGRFNAAYTCGMLVHRVIDRSLSKGGAPGTGLYAVWREYLGRVEAGAPAGEETYLAAVAHLGGQPLADAARRAVHDAAPDFAAIR